MASDQKVVNTVAEFREIVSRTIPLDSPEIAADFCSISPDDLFALLRYVWNLKIVQHLEFEPKTRRKNEELAEKWRQMGNECFRKKQYNDALKAYNQAIMNAEDSLLLVYANRSALLLKTFHYRECLRDLERVIAASENGEEMKTKRHKLFERKAEAELGLGRTRSAKLTLAQAITAVASSDLSSSSKASEEARLRELFNALDDDTTVGSSSGSDSDDDEFGAFCGDDLKLKRSDVTKEKRGGGAGARTADDEYDSEVDIPPNEPNSKHSFLSRLVELSVDESRGRFLVARRHVEPGDVLLSAEPLARVLSPANWTTHCHNCFVFCYDGIPCSDCSMVLFCSEACRKSAKLFHSIECRVLGNIESSIGSDVDRELGTFLRVRMLTSFKVDEVLQLETRLRSDWDPNNPSNRVPSDGDDAVDVGPGGDDLTKKRTRFLPRPARELPTEEDLRGYYAFHCLCVRRLEDHAALYGKAVEACAQLKLLDAAGYFNTLKKSERIGEIYEYFGALLFVHNIGARHQMWNETEVVVPLTGVKNMTTRDLGLSITPPVNFLNHACFPNASVTFCGGFLGPSRRNKPNQVRALTPIKPGEEVTVSYSQSLHSQSASERRGVLGEDWGFTCRCVACVGDWPSFWQCPSGISFQCPYCFSVIDDLFDQEETCRACSRSLSRDLDNLAFAFRTEGGLFNVREPTMRGTGDDNELCFMREAKEKLYEGGDTRGAVELLSNFIRNSFRMIRMPNKSVLEASFLVELCYVLRSRNVRSERL